MKRSATRVGITLLMASSMWFYVQHILIPHQKADAAAHGRSRGNFSDLYPRWLGARELLLHHRDPYSAEITREIQSGYYGRPLDSSRPEDPKDQQGFAYPVFVVFLLAPTVNWPFPLVQTVFCWFLLLLTVASVPLWLWFMGWRLSPAAIAAMTILVLGSFPVIQGLKLQQLSLLVAALIALSVALLSRGHLFCAGILVGLTMIKPQLAAPVAGWWLLWAFSQWRDRQRLVWGFSATLALLLAGAEWVLPGWMARFRDAVEAYRVYTGGAGSMLDTLLGPNLGKVLSALTVVVVIALCWRVRKLSSGTPEFFMMTALVLSATTVIVPKVSPYNQVLLLPAIFFLVRQWRHLFRRSVSVRILALISSAIVFWPWLAVAGLVFLACFLPPARLEQWWAVPLYTSLWTPLAILATQLAAMNEPKPASQEAAEES